MKQSNLSALQDSLQRSARRLASLGFARIKHLHQTVESVWDEQSGVENEYDVRLTPVQVFEERGQHWIDARIELITDKATLESHIVFHADGVVEAGFPIVLKTGNEERKVGVLQLPPAPTA